MVYRSFFSLLLLLTFCRSFSLGQNRPTAQTFCESVRTLVQASYSGFRAIKRNIQRHSDGSTDWVPSITVAGTSDCEGQSDPLAGSSVSCTGATSQSLDDLEPVYQNAVRQLRACLDPSFVFEETHGGKVTRLSTPIKEASFEIKSKDDSPDGPAVRVTLDQFHGTHRTEYEIEIWIDAKGKI